MRVYYDNVIASGLVTRDIAPDSERVAVDEIEAAHAAGQIKRVTSRESWREQERTRDDTRRSRLESARDLVSVVQADHRVLEFANIDGPFGTIAANPIVTDLVDEPLFADLKALGLKDADARHFMYAAANSCDCFITLDPDFLGRKQMLEERCPSLRVMKPSELAAELRLAAHGGQANTRMEPTRR
jgi:hypothetical protein